AKVGSNLSAVVGDTSAGETTHNFLSWAKTNPATVAVIAPSLDVKMAYTFIDSVINLCTMSLASEGVMSAPVPESMFLSLVRVCGLKEAKYWAEIMGFEHEKSYALLSRLIYGQRII